MSLAGAAFLAPAGWTEAPALRSQTARLGLAPQAPLAPIAPLAAGALAGAVAAVAATVARRKVARAAGPLAIPGLPEPAYRRIKDPLLAEMDAGFDPLELGAKQGEDTYFSYREAEQKHGRLAMLATVGWLTSEELQGSIARQLGLKDDLATGEMAPSLLNGGLDKLPGWFLPLVFSLTFFIEIQGRDFSKNVLKYDAKRIPGDLNWDPIGLRAKLEGDGYTISRLHNAEIKHGRAAMIAITSFAFQEFIYKRPVLIEDEVASDRIVKIIDKAIDNVDKAAGLSIPDIPIPFPNV